MSVRSRFFHTNNNSTATVKNAAQLETNAPAFSGRLERFLQKHEIKCTICLQPLREDQPRAKPSTCSHDAFCEECLYHWSLVTRSCPLCKVDFRQFSVLVGRQRETSVLRVVTPPSPKPRRTRGDDLNDIAEAAAHEQFLSACQCRLCGSGDDEDLLLLCDQCNAAWHTYCVGLHDVPAGDWFCEMCVDTRNSGRDHPSDRYVAGSSIATSVFGTRKKPRRLLGRYSPSNSSEADDDSDVLVASRSRSSRAILEDD